MLHCLGFVEDDIAGNDMLEFLVEYATSLANASEQAGLGVCMTFLAFNDPDDTNAEELVRIHTGTES